MELHRAHVIHVPLKSEHALLYLIVPHFDQVVVTTRHKHRLRLVEVYSAHRTIVVLVLVEEALSPVVEQVDAAVVEGCENPRAILMEGQALDTLALSLELRLHHDTGLRLLVLVGWWAAVCRSSLIFLIIN